MLLPNFKCICIGIAREDDMNIIDFQEELLEEFRLVESAGGQQPGEGEPEGRS